MDRIKVLLKLLDENRDELVWEHLCYAERGLYLKFLTKKNIERSEFAEWVSRWAKEDFNIDLPMTTCKEVTILRELVQDKYLSVYPNIALRHNKTDHQGWIRVWICSHMEKELLRR